MTMPTRETTDIAVIGAGVVGLTIALELVDRGHDVTLVDPGPPGVGASYGRIGGTIAGYATSPVGTPEVLRALPSLMFSPDLAARHPPPGAALARPLAPAVPLAIAPRPGRAPFPAP